MAEGLSSHGLFKEVPVLGSAGLLHFWPGGRLVALDRLAALHCDLTGRVSLN